MLGTLLVGIALGASGVQAQPAEPPAEQPAGQEQPPEKKPRAQRKKDAAAKAAAAKSTAAKGDAAGDAAGQGDAPQEEEQPLLGDEVLLSAQRVERIEADRRIVAEGAVVIRYQDMRLEADRVVYHELTRDAIADGNVLFDMAADRLQGEHMELNLATRVGFLDQAQGFVQTYYIAGSRIEKRGPDNYFIRSGTFTTCEGVLPDWSFHATSTELTVDEYIHAWNPNLRLGRVPVFYLPYAIFPVKRDRSTGMLIPTANYTERDGFVLRNAFYWAPRENFDATLGFDLLQNTGWGVNGEMRYLLAPRTQGILNGQWLEDNNSSSAQARRWAVSTRNSHELPLGINLEVEAFIQSDREFRATYADTIEERSNERTTSSFYLNRSWSAWDFSLSGRYEESLLTEQKTTLTRFPELTVDRTGQRLFGSPLYLKVNASAATLSREDSDENVETTRLFLDPELTLPLPLGGVARLLPSFSYSMTWYSENLEGEAETRAVPTFRLSLEGPRPYRIWDLPGGRIEKIKHLVEPRVSYVYTPEVDQDQLPQFDSIDTIDAANRLEYSITNTLYGKVREGRSRNKAPIAGAPIEAPTRVGARAEAAEAAARAPDAAFLSPLAASAAVDAAAGGVPWAPVVPEGGAAADGAAAGADEAPAEGESPAYSTAELLWVKLSQSYEVSTDSPEILILDDTPPGERPFSPIVWEARTRPPGAGFELWWKGDFDVYDRNVGYQNVALSWAPVDQLTLRGEWRTSRDTKQEYVDVGGEVSLGKVLIGGRSRYNLAEDTFLENRISMKYTSQCWDVTLGYVRWTDEYQYSILVSLKGIGTVVKM